MSINSIIKSAIEPIVPVCVPDLYEGAATEYCAFNYSELPDAFGDNKPSAIRYLVQVHYFCQRGANPISTKMRLKNALLNADFTYPSVTNASDKDGQHWVFECEYVDGDVDGFV